MFSMTNEIFTNDDNNGYFGRSCDAVCQNIDIKFFNYFII